MIVRKLLTIIIYQEVKVPKPEKYDLVKKDLKFILKIKCFHLII